MTDIGFTNIDVVGDISILIGGDDPMLHICMDISIGNENEPMTPKANILPQNGTACFEQQTLITPM